MSNPYIYKKVPKITQKLKEKYNNVSPSIKSNLTSLKKYKPHYNFIKDSLEDLSYLELDMSKWDLFSSLRLVHGASKIVDHYNSNFKKVPPSLSLDNNWHYPFGNQLNTMFYDLLKSNYSDKFDVIYSSNDESYKRNQLIIDDLIFAWNESSSESLDVPTVFMFDFKNKEEQYKNFFSLLFNKNYPFKKVRASINDNDQINIHEELFSKEYVKTNKVFELKNEIDNYINYGYNRSYLFYGPPGSGKTNIINGLIKEMDGKSLKFEDISSFDTDLIEDLIRFIRPKIVIFEDVDHMDNHSLDVLLGSIEKISSNCSIILASANEISRLDNALVRPERFDRLISVDKLEPEVVMQFVNNDLDIFESVKNFPAVYIKEFMKRVLVLGKEQAIESSADLFERIENLGYVNYSLSKAKNNKNYDYEKDDDEDDDDEDESYEEVDE